MDVKYPKGERVWTEYISSDTELAFIMTSKETNRDFYFLYEVSKSGKCNKLGKGRSPAELEKKFEVLKKIERRG